MAETSGPWPSPIGGSNGTPMTASQSRAIFGAGLGDGVIEDVTGGGLAVSLISSGTVARIAPGAALLRGTHRYASTANIDLAIPTVTGTGNSRIDTVALKYTPAATTPSTAITAQIVTGTAAASPVPPALTRDATGWTIPLARFTRATAGAAGNLVDLRSWLGPGGPVYASSAALPADAPIGSTATLVDGTRWWVTLIGGSPQWVSDSPLASAYLAATSVVGGTAVGQFTVRIALTTSQLRSGMTRPDSYRIGVPYTGNYRVGAQALVRIPSGAGNGFAHSEIRIDSGGSPTGGTLAAESWDWIPPGAGAVTLSTYRDSLTLTAGSYLEWYLTVPAGGGLSIGGSPASTTITVSANG